MTRSNLATQFGQVAQFASFQFTNADLTAAATTQTITLLANPASSGSPNFTLPQGSFILYTRVKHSVAFSGGGLTSMKIRVGKTGGATNFFAPDFDVFQAVADGTLGEFVNTQGMGQLSAVTVTVTFTSDAGHNVSVATAGTVNVDIFYVPVSTPTFIGAYGSGQVL